ncbi:uncharacterized protein [Primulina eburnea]|uniref:uncharacterized protein n=1 Tax=Primulina eburnea TaxID=1245227 RepID=UPI003C6C84C3
MSRDLDVSSEESVNSTYKAVFPSVIEISPSDDEAEIEIIVISSDDEQDLKSHEDVSFGFPSPTPPATGNLEEIVEPTAGNGLLSANMNGDSTSLQQKGMKPKMDTELDGQKVNTNADNDGANEHVVPALVGRESVEIKCYKGPKSALNCTG